MSNSAVKTEIIKIEDILHYNGTQIRAAMDDAVVQEYMEAYRGGAQMPPIDVFRYEGHADSYLLADGFYRRGALLSLGRLEVEAVVHEGTRAEAIALAFEKNKARGVRLTARDLPRCIMLAQENFPDKTQEQIAAMVGCSQGTVAKLKAQLAASEAIIPGNNGSTAIRVNAKGEKRPTTYKKRKVKDTPAPEFEQTQAEPEAPPQLAEPEEKRRVRSADEIIVGQQGSAEAPRPAEPDTWEKAHRIGMAMQKHLRELEDLDIDTMDVETRNTKWVSLISNLIIRLGKLSGPIPNPAPARAATEVRK